MNNIKIIAFTHRTTELVNIGRLYIDEAKRSERLNKLKELGLNELVYLSTCNRVELIFIDDFELTNSRKTQIFSTLYPDWNTNEVNWAIDNSADFEGSLAVKHLFETASSLDSLVVGEREIITQVRKAYDECTKYGLTNNYLRLLLTKTIECAKKVYTNTNIARNPVSVVSLAFRTLTRLNLSPNSRILLVGAGETNTKMCKFLYKNGFKNFTVANRTFEKAALLAKQLKGEAIALADIENFTKGFDLIITCTGSKDAIFTPELYQKLLAGETDKKVIVDLAIPNDVSSEVVSKFPIHYIEVEGLKKISEKNLAERKKELSKCNSYINNSLTEFEEAFEQRQIEIAMRDVPLRMKEIKDMAFNKVFAKDIESLDENGKEVLNKMFTYLEKKYISVPMKMAKEIMLSKK